ncbi:MAG: four helix bundle protein [Acidobacteria bacterium]|nr:four helix bundle protein [Acidobacteriota bacterium]
MDAEELKTRTRAFALRVIKLVESLPKTQTATVIGGQLLRCGTSVGANYRASCRARSRADFIAEMAIVEEEADESIYWIQLLVDAGLVNQERVANLLNEADQLLSIIVSSINTARGGRR